MLAESQRCLAGSLDNMGDISQMTLWTVAAGPHPATLHPHPALSWRRDRAGCPTGVLGRRQSFLDGPDGTAHLRSEEGVFVALCRRELAQLGLERRV